MKGIRVAQIAKEIKFKGVCGNLESKKRFPETASHKIFETSFNLKQRTMGKV